MRQAVERFDVRLAKTEADVLSAQRLRYEVFVQEMGGDGALVDHAARLERDAFDAHVDHLVLVDLERRPKDLDHVVGAYRLLPGARAETQGGFYSAGEYDLTPLLGSGRNLLELGRSCLHRDYRGGAGLMRLWQGLAAYIARAGTEILFGVASFPGTDLQALAQPLTLLHHRHLAPPELRVRAWPEAYEPLNRLPLEVLDRPTAARQIPALLKSYLRLGGGVGEGAFVDRAFNTTDVCLVMDVTKVSPEKRALYGGA